MLVGDCGHCRISLSQGRINWSNNQLLTLDKEAIQGCLGEDADDIPWLAALVSCGWSIQLSSEENGDDNVQSAALASCGWNILAQFFWLLGGCRTMSLMRGGGTCHTSLSSTILGLARILFQGARLRICSEVLRYFGSNTFVHILISPRKTGQQYVLE